MWDYVSCFLLLFVIYLDHKNELFRRRVVKRIFAIILLMLLSCSLVGCIFVTSDSKTPYIQDRYWYIDGENTGVKAEGVDGADGKDGVDGKTPYIQDGYWYIDGVNTGIMAECPNCSNKNDPDEDQGSADEDENDNQGGTGEESGGNQGSTDEPDDSLPEYWKSYLDDKIAEINSKLASLGNGADAFIFITDQHLDGSEDYSAEIINYIAKHSSVNKVIFGGDMLQGGSNDVNILDAYRDSFDNDVLVIAMRGNHDATGNLTEGAFYDIMISPLIGKVDVSDELYYCFDNEDQKIRYIVTDSVASKTDKLTSAEQIAWMQARILELDQDWTTIIFHHGIWEGSATNSTLSYSTDGKLIIDAVDAIYDQAKCTIAGILSGHNHRDYFGYSDKGYALISTTVNSSNSALTKYDAENFSRPTGTIKEEAMDVVFIDSKNCTIETIRIGAGKDRAIEYESNQPRDVESVSLNKTVATTWVGGKSISLSAILTPAKVTDDQVIWSVESGAELGAISYDKLECIFTPGDAAGEVVIQVKTVQGGFVASCIITILAEATEVDITSDFAWTPGSITYADGVASSQYEKDWLYSSMVDVGDYDSITFTHIQTTNTLTPLGYAFYDADGRYLSGASNGGGTYDTAVKTVKIPNGAKYFRVMWMNTTHSRYEEEKYEIAAHFFCYGNIDSPESDVTDKTGTVDITADFVWTPGSITYANGVASSQYATDWLYSNMVDVGEYKSITFTHVQTTNTATPLGYAFYDANGRYISGASNGGGTYDTAVKTVEVPDGAVYFRVMWMNTTHSRYNEEIYGLEDNFYCLGNY